MRIVSLDRVQYARRKEEKDSINRNIGIPAPCHANRKDAISMILRCIELKTRSNAEPLTPSTEKSLGMRK
jgi:hypothetical protein